jgi:multidrug efflux pump subunit AcrB
VILLLFLGNLRASFVSLAAIPVSLVARCSRSMRWGSRSTP